MTNRFLKIILSLCIVLILGGCAGRQSVKESPPFKAIDLNPRIASGDYVQKVDQFLVILDVSGTTKRTKYQTARDLVKNMNLTIPNLRLKAGIRVFGEYGDQNTLVYGMVDHTRSEFEAAIPVSAGYGQSPLGESIASAGLDLKQASGNMALIIFSDGLETGRSSIEAAEALKKQYGDRLCIYAVSLGSSSRGKKVLEGVSRSGRCGFVVNPEEIQSPEGMAGFVEKIFLAKAPPKPGPAVVLPSPPASPPAPPKPKEVRSTLPPPLDSDGDGVLNDVDKCPSTPRGAKVDKEGCWVLPITYFDTAEWSIKKEFFPALNEVATVLKSNPEVKVVIVGHTDNRGTGPYNKELSEKRAKEVQSYFIKAGVSRERLTPWGYGEKRPAVPNTSPENMAKNRRVDLIPVK
jgi:OOP family OmpA-OmpF porin